MLQPAVGNTGGVLMYAIPACSQTSSHDLNLASRDLVLANKFRFGSVNAGRQDWNAAVHLISRIAKEDPEFLLSRITQIEGLDLEKINWAIEDPSVECPVVCLN